MQQVDDPPSLAVGTEVSAKYKGAFCEAKVSKVVRNIKVKVAYKQSLGSGIVSDDAIKAASGQLRVGAVVEVRHPERKEYVEATVTKIQDCSQYTVVFDDGDITTLRRTALCLKSGRHFNESETLDQLPLTHPEHFGNPVVGGRRGRRRAHANDDSSEEEDEVDVKEVVNEKEENIGKIICVEIESKKKDKEKWFPGLVVAPTAQATVRIRVKDEYLVRSFKDGRYYTVPKKEANEFTREIATKQDSPAVHAALEYLDSDILPPHWDRDELFGLSNTSSEEEAEVDSESSDDEPHEEKDRFVAQLYKYMDDRGTPLNKMPSIQSRDVDLYRLFRAVQKRGGYNRVTAQNQWKPLALRLGFTPVTVSVANLVKQAYKKFLQPYCDFHRKLGCSMIMTSRNSNRSKGRSLVRANSVASPKPVESSKDSSASTKATPSSLASVSSTSSISAMAQQGTGTTSTPVSTMSGSATSVATASQSVTDESENTSESSTDTTKNKRKTSMTNNNKVKGLIEKYEEKATASKDDGDMPLSKMKAVVSSARAEEKVKEKDKESQKEIDKDKEREKEKEKEKENEKEKEKEKEREKEIIKDISTNSGITSTARDNSPTGPNNLQKKEKIPRKPNLLQTEEKRGKRKKEDSAVEKVESNDFPVEVGDKLKVFYHEKKVTYEAKVIEITLQKGTPMFLVHYTGWNNRYDEWVPRERIAENLTKGSKQKGRFGSTEKSRENPPKPPSSMSLLASSNISPTGSSITSTLRTPTTGGAKRGRGRSDSLPPRSTTPSSVASNSSRTKSPASASLKKRPTRIQSNIIRRISANISDVSVPTDSDSDSDEPVRRPTRAAKETPSKSGSSASSMAKTPARVKKSVSATNSQTETDDDEEIATTSGMSIIKGRDYDLNQIRSELKGFQGLKSPTGKDANVGDTKLGVIGTPNIKTEQDAAYKSSSSSNVAIKKEAKIEPKEETTKSSTEVTSESDSFGDDDSQSSDKTTTLENMRKKFQQKINADKQRKMEKQPTGKARIVEKIIKDSLAEKRQESLKTKPSIKEEAKSIKTETDSSKTMDDMLRKPNTMDIKDDNKMSETKVIGAISGRYASSTANVTSKYTSVIVEKPSSAKKGENTNAKRFETSKRSNEAALTQSKKLIEPAYKELLKVEPPAAGSPSSTTSSSSIASSSSASTSTSRSLPDMSKLDISGSSSASSAYATSSNKETKLASTISKPISPDIYEFKDPEPFEFEVRKSPMVQSGATTSSQSTISHTQQGSRKQSQKLSAFQQSSNEREHQHQTHSTTTSVISSPMASLVNRKKRGSPLKDSGVEKAKQIKMEEKVSPLVADAKLVHPPLSATNTPSNPHATPFVKSATTVVQSKVITVNPGMISNTTMLAPPPPISASLSSCHHVAQTKIDIHMPSSHANFDALRKSPSFNLNINALNEELAQTVQETTRVLTVALQAPITPPVVSKETTPTKMEQAGSMATAKNKNTLTSSSPNTVPTKLSTPPNAHSTSKATAGSPFVETRRDLSNVFELSSAEGSSSINELKDNKFELENVKILLSASVGGFDLEPVKYESKPTSIADKVLKAISQKKEEVENKNKEKDDEPMKHSSVIAAAMSPALRNSAAQETSTAIVSLLSDPQRCDSEVSSLGIGHDKKDIPLMGSDKYLPASPSSGVVAANLLSKNTPMASPEPKLGILESIAVKNNELSETIQKLECAIQRKTPVSGLSISNTLPTAIGGIPSNFSDDSEDSTDSERRLVIEDINDDAIENQKNTEQRIGLPVKLDAGAIKLSYSAKNAPEEISKIPAPIPLKVITSSQRLTSAAGSPSNVPFSVTKIAGSTPMSTTTAFSKNQISPTPSMSTTSRQAVLISANQSISHGSVPESNLKLGEHNVLTVGDAAATISKQLQSQITSQTAQRGSTVVPIIVPDIPVSVVVASSAVPSIVAAAKAAAAQHNPKAVTTSIQKPEKQHLQQPVPCQMMIQQSTTSSKSITTNLHQTLSMQAGGGVGGMPTPTASKAFINTRNLSTPGSIYNLPKSTSGFYLDPHTELRPDDGVKPITDESVSTDEHMSFASSAISNIEAHNDSINLLCEETIPGSPAPAFGGKDEPLCSLTAPQTHIQQQIVQQQNVASHTLGETNMDLILKTTTGGNMPVISTVPPTLINPTANSSPNDSQDESSEELKKNVDVENEVLPRKRRRTRKQSDVVGSSTSVSSDQQQQHLKRRRALTYMKKNTTGSDSDDNSDTISQRSTTSGRQQQQQQQQIHQQQTGLGIRPCPYNFLVQLDPSLSSDQCIAILLKQIQDLRKTYNMIKSDLASIDRRRKKLRRREREKKQLQQQQQQQQQIKISS